MITAHDCYGFLFYEKGFFVFRFRLDDNNEPRMQISIHPSASTIIMLMDGLCSEIVYNVQRTICLEYGKLTEFVMKHDQ